jgi:hypothetical protein
MITQTEISKFLDADLFVELGMDKLSPAERISFSESFGNVIEQRLIRRLARELDSDQKKALNDLLAAKKDDSGAMDAFLKTKQPDLGRLVAEEVANYKKELLEGFHSMMGAVDINES